MKTQIVTTHSIVLAWNESSAATKIRQGNPLRKKETAEQLSRTAERSGKNREV